MFLVDEPLLNSQKNCSAWVANIGGLMSIVLISPALFRILGAYTFGKPQGTIGRTPNSVPMVFIVFFRDSCGL